MKTQENESDIVESIVDAILANDLSTIPDKLKYSNAFLIDACLTRWPPIENLQQIVKTVCGHEKLTNKEIRKIKPAYILEENIPYFAEGNNIITFIKIFYPPEYSFNRKELYTINDIIFNHTNTSKDIRCQMLLKFLQYYTAQFRKRLK